VPEPPVSPDPDEMLAAARGQSVGGLLSILEQLGGAEECAVVRGALEAGVPPAVVLEELQREVRRRLMRQRSFYDEAEW
jgi:hypothetical protein